MAFAAREISTPLTWDHLVLRDHVRHQLQDVRRWLDHNSRLTEAWGLGDRIGVGYRALFHGPPGTGKTLAATLLASQTGRPIFRVDLATVTSKFIGETEKNLGPVFDRAGSSDWILFFDEADALFGKRTNVEDSHDRYANHEVAYLLQRLEAYRGLAILATNRKSILDDAFLRRFNLVVGFPFPTREERQDIWRAVLPTEARCENGVDFPELFSAYELTPGSVVNVVHAASLAVMDRDGEPVLRRDDVERAIKLEMAKVGEVTDSIG